MKRPRPRDPMNVLPAALVVPAVLAMFCALCLVELDRTRGYIPTAAWLILAIPAGVLATILVNWLWPAEDPTLYGED